MSWGAAIGAAGSIIGGLIGKTGQASANQANARLAAQNRAFQERMSNTAYQRAAQDLDKAGLNRILAIGSPATTPAGNVARMENAAKPLGQGVSSAAMNAAQIGLIKAQTAKANAEARILGPKETIMSGITSGLETAQNQSEDAGQWFKDQSNKMIANAITNRGGSAKETKSLKERQTKMNRIADELGIDTSLLINALIGMDQVDPKWSDEQKLKWAVQNQEAVKRYLYRKGMKK